MLPPDEVHLWHAGLDQPEETLRALANTLSADERRRAERIVFETQRKRWIASRGILRDILSHYLRLPAEALSLQTTAGGKPGVEGLHFNLSHSENRAVYGITLGRNIGVDVERIRHIDVDTIARRFFSDGEFRSLEALPAVEKLRAFFTCWTRKEAYIKARGQGLAIALRSFAVSLDAEPRLLWNADPAEMTRWTMAAFAPAHDYEGAIVVEGNGWQTVPCTWERRHKIS
jgi:4'-phosphopantetheinyl transferase